MIHTLYTQINMTKGKYDELSYANKCFINRLFSFIEKGRYEK